MLDSSNGPKTGEPLSMATILDGDSACGGQIS
jgi:hypothetical protein